MSEFNNINDLFSESYLNTIKDTLDKADNDDEKEKIIEKFTNIDLNKIYMEFVNEISSDTLSYLKSTMYEEVMRFRTVDMEFNARLEQKWYKAFVASEAMYILVSDAAQMYLDYVKVIDEKQKEPKQWTFLALRNIHGRAMQIFLEILTLMKNGFADGAYARWRSMYELFITASFILQNGEKTAKSFYESSEGEDRYDWAKASSILKNKQGHIKFDDIRRNCNVNTNKWKNEYNLANKIVHPSSQGTFRRLCNMGTVDVIPIGKSDYGLMTPGEHSAITLAQISSLFFTIFPNGDILVQLKIILEWIDVIREAYFKTHDEVFPDDKKLWDENMFKQKNKKE